jgi:AsmA protein
MRKWIVVGVILIVLVSAGAAVLLNLNSLIARNRDFLIGQAERAFGRKIAVGDVEATLLGGIGVRLTNFSMTDDPGYSAGEFVRAKDLQVNLKLWPLLKKEFQVKTVILHDPVIQIIRGADGDFNFSTIGKSEKDRKPGGEKETKEPAPGEPRDRSAFLISLVNISNGDIRYIDKKDGSDLRARQIDLEVEDFDYDEPFSVKLAAALFADKQNVKLTTKVGPLGSAGDFTLVPLVGELELDPLDMGQLKKALPRLKNSLPKEFDFSGVFSVKSLKFSGTLKDLGFKSAVEGTNGALRYGTAFQKAAGIPLVLEADARYAGDKIAIRKSRLTLHTLKLAAVGDVQLGDATVLNLSVDSEPASLGGWEKIVPAIARYRLTGNMEVQATVRGKAGKGATPQVQGTLNLQKASAQPPDFPKPIENVDTTINFTGERANIKDMTLSLGKSKIRLAAVVEKFSPLTLSYKMSAPEVWPADYQASLAEERKADVIRNLQSEGQFTMAGDNMVYQGKLASADGTLYNVAYKNLDTVLSLADQVANIRSLKVNALNGAVQLQGEYAFKDAAPRFSMASKVQGVDVKQLYTALDAKAAHDIRGRLNGDVKLSGSGKNWEEIKPALRGQGDAEVLQGALLNFNIAEGALGGITGIPGLTNVFNPALRKKYPETFTAKDTEFKELKATFDLAGGRINVKNLRMAAAEFIVQGNGWADFNRRVDFRSRVNFSQRLSADMSQSTREIKYLLNNQGELEIPIALTGKMPNVKPKPDTKYLAQMAQRGFARKGIEELQDRFLGGKPSSEQDADAPADGKKKKRSSTEDRIRKGLEGLFRR